MRWKPFRDSRYDVSNNGQVRRMRGGKGLSFGRPLKLTHDRHGYLRIGLYLKPKKQTNFLVHRLVGEVFIGPCPSGMETNHKDGNKQNNDYRNLEYVTKSEQALHAFRLGLRKAHRPIKYSDEMVEEIRKAYLAGVHFGQLMRQYRLNCSTLSCFIRGDRGYRNRNRVSNG